MQGACVQAVLDGNGLIAPGEAQDAAAPAALRPQTDRPVVPAIGDQRLPVIHGAGDPAVDQAVATDLGIAVYAAYLAGEPSYNAAHEGIARSLMDKEAVNESEIRDQGFIARLTEHSRTGLSPGIMQPGYGPALSVKVAVEAAYREPGIGSSVRVQGDIFSQSDCFAKEIRVI